MTETPKKAKRPPLYANKPTNQDVHGWGPLTIVITDDLSILPKIQKAVGAQECKDLEDYVPLRIQTLQVERMVLWPTHLCDGITERRKAGIPWIGYALVRPNEKAYLLDPSDPKTPYTITQDLAKARRYPSGFFFYSNSEVQYLNGQLCVTRYRAGPASTLEKHILETFE